MPAFYTGTTTLDVVDANDSLLSLREAVQTAIASVNVADTVIVPSGTYKLTLVNQNGVSVDVNVDDTTEQRSKVTSISVTFSTLVDLDLSAGAFRLTRTGPSTPTGNVTFSISTADVNGRTVVTLEFHRKL